MGKKARRNKTKKRFWERILRREPAMTVDSVKVEPPVETNLPKLAEFREWLRNTPEARDQFEEFCKENQLNSWRWQNGYGTEFDGY